ncbi:MAG: hypothetical protein VXW65_02580 [Pseudomonadota bacterium]|nr:hypothetical protein [Pseudomonadota bacterium]
MKTRSLMAASFYGACIVLLGACGQSNSESRERTEYVSENQKFVDQLDKEVELQDPDSLLDDLNQGSSDTQQ